MSTGWVLPGNVLSTDRALCLEPCAEARKLPATADIHPSSGEFSPTWFVLICHEHVAVDCNP